MPLPRVIHLVNSLGMGGAERTVCELMEGLDRTRYAPRVVCLFEPGAWAGRVEQAGIPVHTIGLEPGVRVTSLPRVAGVLHRLRPTIVHTHLAEAAWYGIPAATLVGVRGGVLHLQNCYWHWGRKLQALNRVTTAPAAKIIACSEAVQHFAVERLRYAPAKVRVIYNGVDVQRRLRSPSRDAVRGRMGIPAYRPVLITVASLTPQKGHAILLEALVRLRARALDPVVLLVGDGELRPQLADRVDELSLRASVRFLGRRDDVRDLLAAADIFVLPSLWEGLPLVLAEAGAGGLPAVASAVDGIPEVVVDGITGRLVPPRDPVALADALAELLGSHEQARAMGSRARALVAARFDVRMTVKRVQDVYDEVLGEDHRLAVQSLFRG